jgi:hypothetical protein
VVLLAAWLREADRRKKEGEREGMQLRGVGGLGLLWVVVERKTEVDERNFGAQIKRENYRK